MFCVNINFFNVTRINLMTACLFMLLSIIIVKSDILDIIYFARLWLGCRHSRLQDNVLYLQAMMSIVNMVDKLLVGLMRIDGMKRKVNAGALLSGQRQRLLQLNAHVIAFLLRFHIFIIVISCKLIGLSSRCCRPGSCTAALINTNKSHLDAWHFGYRLRHIMRHAYLHTPSSDNILSLHSQLKQEQRIIFLIGRLSKRYLSCVILINK